MTVTRHLVLVHQPGYQHLEDFQAIAAKVRELAPDIEVFIASNAIPSSVTRRLAARQPSLIFSPGNLISFQPARGKIYAGRPIPKLEQMRRFAAAGLPVPDFAELTPDFVPRREIFGSPIVLKPDSFVGSHSHGMALVQIGDLRYRAREEFPDDHPGHYGAMIVQRFIDTGEHQRHYRVHTLFGAPLQAREIVVDQKRPPLDLSTEALSAAMPFKGEMTGVTTRRLIEDRDVLDLARKAYEALPEIPLMGCDIVRERESDRLYLLEVNPGGNTWPFAPGFSERLKKAVGVDDLKAQFDAITTSARALIERTRADAE